MAEHHSGAKNRETWTTNKDVMGIEATRHCDMGCFKTDTGGKTKQVPLLYHDKPQIYEKTMV